MTIEKRLRSLAERQGELATLTKKIAMVTEAANESAASLRLERANRLVTSLTESVKSLREFRDILSEGSGAELVTIIEKLIRSVQKARVEVEK